MLVAVGLWAFSRSCDHFCAHAIRVFFARAGRDSKVGIKDLLIENDAFQCIIRYFGRTAQSVCFTGIQDAGGYIAGDRALAGFHYPVFIDLVVIAYIVRLE